MEIIEIIKVLFWVLIASVFISFTLFTMDGSVEDIKEDWKGFALCSLGVFGIMGGTVLVIMRQFS